MFLQDGGKKAQTFQAFGATSWWTVSPQSRHFFLYPKICSALMNSFTVCAGKRTTATVSQSSCTHDDQR